MSKFDNFLSNDWKHLTEKVWRIEGILWVLMPVVIGIFLKLYL